MIVMKNTFRAEVKAAGPTIEVDQVLETLAEVAEYADGPGDLVDDLLHLISLLAREPGHHMLAVNKAQKAALEWLNNYGKDQP